MPDSNLHTLGDPQPRKPFPDIGEYLREQERKKKLEEKLRGKKAQEEITLKTTDEETPLIPLGTQHVFHKGFVYIPTVNIWFAEELSLNETNWHDCHKELAKQTKTFPNNYNSRLKMPTPKETWALILYAKEHLDDLRLKKIYNDILKKQPEGSWRAEWQNIRFVPGTGFKNLDLETVVVDSNGDLSTIKEPLKVCLETSGYTQLKINSQGLLIEESKDTEYKQGENIYFYTPVGSFVARFVAVSDRAGLYCSRNPASTNPSLGVRASAPAGARINLGGSR
jgi:hypothetical protein